MMTNAGCPSRPLADTVFGARYLPCQVTELPELLDATASARYPDLLRAVATSGRVRIAFIVDTTGRYRPGSVRVLASSHEQFFASVKQMLQGARFVPGRRGREAVAVELTHDFVFAIPSNASARELGMVSEVLTIAQARSPLDIPVAEIRLDAEDSTLGAPPAPVLRDSLAHAAIRALARSRAAQAESAARTSGAPSLVLCVQGDTNVFESAADRALAPSMTAPHVRVMTMRSCPPTRASMVALPPEMTPRHSPDSVPFVEPYRLRVARVALRSGGGPQIDMVEEHMLGEQEYRCVRVLRAVSIFELRCLVGRSIVH
jgi:TonB family protein